MGRWNQKAAISDILWHEGRWNTSKEEFERIRDEMEELEDKWNLEKILKESRDYPQPANKPQPADDAKSPGDIKPSDDTYESEPLDEPGLAYNASLNDDTAAEDSSTPTGGSTLKDDSRWDGAFEAANTKFESNPYLQCQLSISGEDSTSAKDESGGNVQSNCDPQHQSSCDDKSIAMGQESNVYPPYRFHFRRYRPRQDTDPCLRYQSSSLDSDNTSEWDESGGQVVDCGIFRQQSKYASYCTPIGDEIPERTNTPLFWTIYSSILPCTGLLIQTLIDAVVCTVTGIGESEADSDIKPIAYSPAVFQREGNVLEGDSADANCLRRRAREVKHKVLRWIESVADFPPCGSDLGDDILPGGDAFVNGDPTPGHDPCSRDNLEGTYDGNFEETSPHGSYSRLLSLDEDIQYPLIGSDRIWRRLTGRCKKWSRSVRGKIKRPFALRNKCYPKGKKEMQ